MQFNTALSFILCGIFMLLVSCQKPDWGFIPGILLFIIATATLLEYTLSVNLGIDQLFMKNSLMVETSYPGRMALNTATGFILCAIAGRLSIGNPWQIRLSGILGSLIFGLGVVAFVGHITSLRSAYSWNLDVSMAIHTALAFMIVGIGITLQSLISELKLQSDHQLTMNSWLSGYAVSLALILTILNFTLPHQFEIEILYVLLVLFGWFMPYKRAPFILAAISTILICLRLFFFKDYDNIDPLIVNASFAVLALWIVAGLLGNIKSASLKLQTANEELDEQVIERTKELHSRNRDLEQFVYIASHDLQEPLRTVTSLTTRLTDRHSDQLDVRASQYLNYINEASNRMTTLIKDLLDYSNLGVQIRFARVNCKELIANLKIDMTAKLEGSNAHLQIGYLPTVRASSTELRLLFQNLISNSIKFGSNDRDPQVRIHASRRIGEWVFSVSDNGIGIPERHKEKIFDMFQRIHPRSEYAGNGIGLSHCKKIVELHGGKIWLESELGVGTTFYFTLPTEIKKVSPTKVINENGEATSKGLRTAASQIPRDTSEVTR